MAIFAVCAIKMNCKTRIEKNSPESGSKTSVEGYKGLQNEDEDTFKVIVSKTLTFYENLFSSMLFDFLKKIFYQRYIT